MYENNIMFSRHVRIEVQLKRPYASLGLGSQSFLKLREILKLRSKVSV